MNFSFSFAVILCAIGIFFEHVQHRDYQAKHPDYEKCPSGVVGFAVIGLFCLVKTFL